MEKYNIDSLYQQLLPRLEKLESERLALTRSLSKFKKLGIGAALVLTISLTYFTGFFFGLLVGAAVGVTIYTLMYHKSIKSYRSNYKSRILSEFVEELGERFQYTPDGSIDDKSLRSCGIFHEFTKSKFEDLIEGSSDSYSFKMAETNLWFEKVNKVRGGERNSVISFIFKGLFFVGNIRLSFPTPIWILAKDHPMVHPVSRIQDDWRKVKVENKEFRLTYDVYAGDSTVAEKILRDSILTTILRLKEDLTDKNMRMEMSFQGNKVYISIATTRELFEPPVKTPITDKKHFEADFKFLVKTTGLLQELTLVES